MRWEKFNYRSMTYILINKFTKNYCIRAIVVQVIVEDVLPCFFFETVYKNIMILYTIDYTYCRYGFCAYILYAQIHIVDIDYTTANNDFIIVAFWTSTNADMTSSYGTFLVIVQFFWQFPLFRSLIRAFIFFTLTSSSLIFFNAHSSVFLLCRRLPSVKCYLHGGP